MGAQGSAGHRGCSCLCPVPTGSLWSHTWPSVPLPGHSGSKRQGSVLGTTSPYMASLRRAEAVTVIFSLQFRELGRCLVSRKIHVQKTHTYLSFKPL